LNLQNTHESINIYYIIYSLVQNTQHIPKYTEFTHETYKKTTIG